MARIAMIAALVAVALSVGVGLSMVEGGDAGMRGLVRLVTGGSLPLERTTWKLVQIGSESVASASPPVVRFGGSGVGGFDGCTTFKVDGRIDGERMSLDARAMAIAPRACPPSFLLPGAFRGALLAATRVVVDGDRLTLHAADGSVLARFRGEP